MIGETLEWRVKREGGKLKPFATILRFRWDADDRQGSTLVVTKLGEDDACHMAYVEATNNPKANEQARATSPTRRQARSPASRDPRQALRCRRSRKQVVVKRFRGIRRKLKRSNLRWR